MPHQSSGWINWFKRARHRKKSQLANLREGIRELGREVERAKMLSAQGLIHEFARHAEPVPLTRREFRVFSQFGDDGIIQYLLQRLNLPASEQRFVEFGVEDYTESNTRFLLLNNNWSGLVMDGSDDDISYIKKDEISWRHDLTALARFITRDNINALLEEAGFTGRIGLLNIDIDGNDYWVWEAITVADPAIVIVEYNGLFGPREAVTIPYQPDFTRAAAHSSHLYWGASLAAFCHLAEKKGYVWIGTNSAGNNAYFVRKAQADRFLHPRLPDDFIGAKYREARDAEGRLTFQGQREGFSLVQHLSVWDVVQDRTRPISALQR